MRIILYDGVCALCNNLVRVLLRIDRQGLHFLAPLDGETAKAVLSRHPLETADLDSACLVIDAGSPDESILVRSEAVVGVLEALPGWRWLAVLLRIAPRRLRDAVYDAVARTRYRVFGRYDSCPIPDPAHRARFLP